MKLVYYFNPLRMEKDKNIVQSIYGSDVTFINDKPWSVADMFEEGDILICGSVDELVDTEADIDQIVKEYMSIFCKGVELVFDKSTQCNSLFIKTLIEKNDDFKQVLRKCVINYMNQRDIEIKYSRKHMITAKANGNKVGIKKGTKLITKKSIEMKERIKKLSKDFGGDKTDEELIKELGIARNSYYRYKKDLREGGD